jgi:predicted secreted protein
MKFVIGSTRLTLVSIASMLLSLSISSPADANNNLKIGIVKHDLTSGVCFAYIPGTQN